MQRPEPIFIRGIMPRSGTNWVADILRLQPGVAVGPNRVYEFPHFLHTPLLLDYVSAVASSPHAGDFSPERFQRKLGDAWLAYFDAYAPEGHRLVLKYPGMDHIATSFDFFPDSRVVLVVRDGRDVVASALKSGFVAPPSFRPWRPRSWRRLLGPSDLRLLARRYARAADALLDFEARSAACGRGSRVRRVHFERLLQDTRGEVEGLLAWAGIDPGACPWDEVERLPVRGSSWGDGVQASQTRGRWLDWPSGDRQAFDAEAGGALEALGYERMVPRGA